MTLLLLLACAGTPASDPCLEMCAAAERLYGGCLEDWGTDWGAAGYDDGADFIDACETWAWELRLLGAEAGDSGGVDQTCQDRAALFDQGECADFTDASWDGL